MTTTESTEKPLVVDWVQAVREMTGIELTADQIHAFDRYRTELIDWNQRINLTAITEPDAINVRHFLDSLTIFKALTLPVGARVIDVGTGAGFPGLPLRIIRSDLNLTLLEATGKKATFLRHIVTLLGFDQVQVVTARAEEAGQARANRERYNVVLARAVARLPTLAEYMLPLCEVGGQCVALKGETASVEVKDAERAIRTFGGQFERIVEVRLPGVAEPHSLVALKKIKPTPAAYPRQPGTPTKKPLV